MMGLRLLPSAAMLAALCVAGAEARGEEPTSGTLTVSAMSLLGEPLAGVAFRVGGGEVKTNAAGMARAELAVLPPAAEAPAALADDRYRSAGVVVTRATGTRRIVSFHRLFPSDPAMMAEAERVAYIRELPGILSHSRTHGATAPAGQPMHPLRLSALLAGVRQAEEALDLDGDALAAMEDAGDVPADTGPRLETRVLSLHGQPVEGRIVELLALDEEGSAVRVVGRERTRPGGVAVFHRLKPGPVYRVVVPAEADGLSAASAPAMLEGAATAVPPVVLQPAQRRLSGLVYSRDAPEEGAEVASGGEGQPRLTTVTDRFGYFELAPLKEGSATVTIRRKGTGRGVAVALPLDGNEVLIPLELVPSTP